MMMLLMFLSETQTHGEIPLFEAVIRKLNASGVAGASVFRGIMGFGSDHHVHRGRLFGVSDDRPMAVLAADSEEHLRAVLPALRELAPDAPILLLPVEKT